MSDEKASRLAAIRAANAAKRLAPDTAPVRQPPTEALLPAVVEQPAPVAPPPQRNTTSDDAFADMPPAMPPQTLLAMLLGAVAGAVVAVVLLPTWLPGLSNSLLGPEPGAYWYLARSSAFVAYGLLWLAMLFGLLMTSKLARLWPGGPLTFDLHQHTSLLGLAFALFHALILLGDRYIQATPVQVLLPFAYSGFAPFWVGLGQLGLYGLALVGLSFYVKERMGRQLWRVIHTLSFVIFALALAHGIMSGSDSASSLARMLYWASAGSVLFLTIYRVMALSVAGGRAAKQPARSTAK